MTPFLLKLMVGHTRRHRLEAVLCLVGVALGVAVVIAIDAAVSACVDSFGGAVRTLAERSTHSVFADAGSLTDEQYIDLAPPRPAVPAVAGRSTAGCWPGETFARLIGVDVFAERRMRTFTQMQSALTDDAFRRFMTEPGAVVLVRAPGRRPARGRRHGRVGSRSATAGWTPTWSASSRRPAWPRRSWTTC